MTQEDDRLRELISRLPVKEADEAMAERIFSRAVAQPQRRPARAAQMLGRIASGLWSQWPEDMAVKAAALAAVILITFSAGMHERPPAHGGADINFVALAMGQMGGGFGGAL
jgi:hypothetical protein